jgi:hypothetical protein
MRALLQLSLGAAGVGLGLVACGPIESYDTGDFQLTGTWAVQDVTKKKRVATKTKIEFSRDGSWELKREGDLCGLPLEGWFCEGKGEFKLRPDEVLEGDETTLVITPKGQKKADKYDAWFVDPDTFCWKRDVLGEECLLRE